MVTFSTNQVAKKLGITTKTLSCYIAQGKVPSPQIMEVGGSVIHVWTEEEIEALRQLLPRIANGRKTRYQNKPKPQSKRKRKPKPAGSARCATTEHSPNRTPPG